MSRLRALVVAAALTATGSIVGVVPGTAPVPVGAVVNPTPTIEPTSRASVHAAYQSSLVEARTVPVGWTGSTATCTKGTESAASIQATQAAVNFYRGLNRLPAVTMNATKNSEAMAAALIMQANNQITHTPPSTFACYTAEGRAAAESSNLSQQLVGAKAIDVYMADPGAANHFAGHRRTVLYPYTTNIGTGSTTNYNALRVYGGEAATRPAGVTWIAWPNAGFVPKRALRPFNYSDPKILFSLSSNQHPDASYSAATVAVTVGGTSLPVTMNPVVNGYGDNTLTWYVTPPADYDTSDADVKFDITVSGVKTAAGAAIPAYSWSSTAFVHASAATAPGPPTGVGATAGNGRATVGWTAPTSNGGSPITSYKVTPYIGATAQTVRTFASTATSQTITGLTNGVGYTFRVQAVNAVGTGALSSPSGVVTPAGPPYAPYSSWTHLIDQVHRQLVGRMPTTAERNQWLDPLQLGTQGPGDLVAALRQSNHHRTYVDPVTRLYRAYFLRIPDRGGLEHWIGRRLAGTSLAAISASFAASAEFRALYPNLTDRAFVQRVYQNVLGRTGSTRDVDFWTAEITSGRRTRGRVMIGFSESPEYRAAQAAEVTVAVLHIMWLDRRPTAQEHATGVAALEGGQSVAAYARTLLPQAAILP